MIEPIRVCLAGDVIEGRPSEANPPGLAPVAVYQVAGEYFVTANLCTHGEGMLSEGHQEDFVIMCPMHGGSFDIRTGEPLSPPCYVALNTYRTKVIDGWVTIEPTMQERPKNGL
jgi:ethylbenzene dioxygenase ferredoxin component